MSRPLFAITVISAFLLSFITTSLVSAHYGEGPESRGKIAIENMSLRQHLNTPWKEYGCHDELNKDLLLAPMWCKEKQNAWGDPLYPFHSAGFALWWPRSSLELFASER